MREGESREMQQDTYHDIPLHNGISASHPTTPAVPTQNPVSAIEQGVLARPYHETFLTCSCACSASTEAAINSPLSSRFRHFVNS
jgi:hypothetical protein